MNAVSAGMPSFLLQSASFYRHVSLAGRFMKVLAALVGAAIFMATSVTTDTATASVFVMQEAVQQKQAQRKTDTERLERIVERFNAKTIQERAALEAIASDSGLVRIRQRVEPEDPTDSADSTLRFMQWIGLRGERPVIRITHNREAAASARIQTLLTGGRTGFDLSGAGQTIAVFDDGHPRESHVELSGRVQRRDAFSTESTHATHVAGTIAASGVWREARGMAPAAQIRSHDWTNDVVEMAQAALDGVLVSNHSYGDPLGWTPNILGDGFWGWMGFPGLSPREDAAFGYYGEDAAAWDDVIDAAAHLVVVKSAGNERERQGPPDGAPHYVFDEGWRLSTEVREQDGGSDGYDSIGDAGVAKNVITVGAVEDAPWGVEAPADVVMTAFSGWGPVDDGRIKPDLVANGTALLSSKSGADDAYGASSGTSQAAPVVTGAVALLQELWQREFPGSVPLSSTIRALLLHSADEAGQAPGPDYQFGWGHLNAERAAQHLKQSADADRIFAPVRPFPVWMFEGQVGPGESVTFELPISEAMTLRSTLAWTDPTGEVVDPVLDNPSSHLVHDLDLSVVQNGGEHLPWVLDPARPGLPATRGLNTRDNVEQVVFDAEQGTVTVRVQAPASMSRGDQRFSLIVGSPLDQPSQTALSTVSGSVRLGSTPVPGINVRLSGPVVRGSRTGDDGVFMVDELPTGTYTISADPSLFDIRPASITVALPEQAGRFDLQATSRMQTDHIRVFESSRLLQSGEQGRAADVTTVPAGGLVGVELTFTPHPDVNLSGSRVVLDTSFDPLASPWSGMEASRLADLSLSNVLSPTEDGRLRFRIPVVWIDGLAPEGAKVRIPFEVRKDAVEGALVHVDTLSLFVSGRDTRGPLTLPSVRIGGASFAPVGEDLEIRASFIDGSPVVRAEAMLVDRFDTTTVLAALPMGDSGDLVGNLDYVAGDGVYSARYYPTEPADYQLKVEAEDAAGNVSQRLLPAFYSSAPFDNSGSLLLLAEDDGTSRTNDHLQMLGALGESPSWWETLVRGSMPAERASSFNRLWLARLNRGLQRPEDIALVQSVQQRGGAIHLFGRTPVQGEEAEAWLASSTGLTLGPTANVTRVRGAGVLAGLDLPYQGSAPRTLELPPDAQPLLVSTDGILAARSGNTVISSVGVGSLTSDEAHRLLLAAFLHEESGTLTGIDRPVTVIPRSDSLLQAQTDSIQVVWETQPWGVYRIEASRDSLFEEVDFVQETESDRFTLQPLVRGERYFWRVRASNPAGDGPWSRVSAIDARPVNLAPQVLIANLEHETGTGVGRAYFGYSQFFADSPGDRLTVTYSVSDPSIVSVEELRQDNGQSIGLFLTPEQAGETVIRLFAEDEEGLMAEASISVVVSANTRPMFAEWPTNPQFMTPRTTRSWLLDALIDENDGDSLRYWVFNENPDIAVGRVESGQLIIEAIASGQSFLAVQVSDGRGGQDQNTLVLSVRENTAPGRNPLVDLPEYLPGDSVALYLPIYFSDPDDDAISLEVMDISGGLDHAVVRNDSLFARLSEGGDPVITVRITDVFEAVSTAQLTITINAAAVVRTEDGRIPERFETLASFPQPFRHRVTLPFTLPAPARVRLDIHDSLGRHVARVFDRSMQAGSHRLDWVPPTGLPAGNYYYQLQAGARMRTGIFVYVR